MPLPTSISDLSQTAASNSPSGSETPNLIDDYFQVYAAYIAQLRDGPGFVSGVKSNVLGTVSLPSYSFVGDTDTGMFSPAANTLAWGIGGAEGMRLDSSANLGVGTTSPQSRLHTVGTLTVSSGGEITAVDQALGIINFRSDDVSASSSGTFASIAARNEFPGGWDGTASRVDTYLAFSTAFDATMAERMRIDSAGSLIQRPPTTPPTLNTNGELVITPTSNTNVRISYRGSDGVTRVGNITLA